MEKWEDLSPKRRKQIAYDWIQSEGYDAQGEEYDSPKEYYEGISTRCTPLDCYISREVRQDGTAFCTICGQELGEMI